MGYLPNDEIKSLGKKLTDAAAENRSKDARAILERLQAGVNPQEDVIRATKIGQIVGKLRSGEDRATAQLAKDLVRTWKNKIDSQREAKKKDSPAASASPITAAASPQSTRPSAAPTPSASGTAKKDALNFDVLGDKTRDTCHKLIHQALEVDSPPDLHLVYERAMAIEQAIFKQHGKGAVTGEYRTKVRSLMLNIKDKRNAGLRQSIISGAISAEKLVNLSAEELASEELKAERNALQMQNLFNAKGAEAQEAETDAFQCGRCKQRKCRYYQKQTRSADEPMTTFVICTTPGCGHKWKFC